jgi:hypothetical protein
MACLSPGLTAAIEARRRSRMPGEFDHKKA